MTPQNVAMFKYRHPDPVMPAAAMVGTLLMIVAAIAVAVYIGQGLGIFFAVVLVIAATIKWPKRQLVMTPRYFMCGNTIVYYANVRQLVLRPGESLSIAWGDNQHFRLERERFPTNARKAPKIAANKLAKFNKVSGKIIDRVKLFAPGVEISSGKAPLGKRKS